MSASTFAFVTVAPPPGFELETGMPPPPDGFELEQPRPPPNVAAANKTFAQTIGSLMTAAKPAINTVEDVGSVYAPVEAALNAGTGLLFGLPAYIGGALGGLTSKYLLGTDADPKELADTTLVRQHNLGRCSRARFRFTHRGFESCAGIGIATRHGLADRLGEAS